MDSTKKRPVKAATVHDLTRPWRGVVLGIGLCSLVAGGMAVFMSPNQAGTLGLLVVGAIAILLAIVGRVPLLFTISGSQIDLRKEVEAAEDLTEAVATKLSPDSTKAIFDQLEKSGMVRPSATAGAMSEWVKFEQEAISRVTGAVTSRRQWTFTSASTDTELDGSVNANGRHVGVEFKLARDRSNFAAWFDRLGRVHPSQPVVLVVNGLTRLTAASRANLKALASSRKVQIVAFDAPDFENRFLAACDRALNQAES